MRKTTKGTGWQGSPLEFLRGGKAVPEGLLRRHMAEVKRRLQARLKERSGIEQEAAKYWSKIVGPAGKVAGGDGEVARAVEGLKGISERLAKRKVAVPRVLPAVSSIQGFFIATVTPPYDFAGADPATLGAAVAEASADKNSGQLSVRAETAFEEPGLYGSSAAAAVTGMYFRPLSPGILRVWANPAFAFSWSANAATDSVLSQGQGCLEVDGFLGTVPDPFFPPLDCFKEWNASLVQGLEFDFGSNAGAPSFLEVEVNPSHWYMLTVSCGVTIAGQWPRSGATASLAITVPSITFELNLIPDVSTTGGFLARRVPRRARKK